MFKGWIGVVVVLCLLMMLNWSIIAGANDLYIPALEVVGDIQNPLKLKSLDGFTAHRMTYGGRTFTAISLQDILERVQTEYDENILFYTAPDLVAQVEANLLADSYLFFSTSYGWEVVNLAHPISSNIKMLEQIIVVAKRDSWDGNGINIISPNRNNRSVTIGELHAGSHWIQHELAGSASLIQGTTGYSSSIYTKTKVVRLSDLVQEELEGTTFIIGEKGEMFRYTGGAFSLRPNRLDFIADHRRGSISDVKGIILDPPVESITDAYHDALYYLQMGEPILLFILDGFGYHQIIYASENGYLPTISRRIDQFTRYFLSINQPQMLDLQLF